MALQTSFLLEIFRSTWNSSSLTVSPPGGFVGVQLFKKYLSHRAGF
jgi:hypothetical protein